MVIANTIILKEFSCDKMPILPRRFARCKRCIEKHDMNSGFSGTDEVLMNTEYEELIEVTHECEELSSRLTNVRREIWARFGEIPGDFLSPTDGDCEAVLSVGDRPRSERE